MRTCTAEHCNETVEDKTCENALSESADGDAHKPLVVHDHEYGEWYCQACWDEYSDEERGLEWWEVEETNGETVQEPGAESEGATS